MSSYWAALCDDEAADRAQIAGLCRDIFTAWGMDAEVIPFASADELRRAPDAALFDLYLLDIRMAGTSGLELARQFYSRGIRDRIIFITGDPEFALEGYDVEPLHYLLKPVSRERMETALRPISEAWTARKSLAGSCSQSCSAGGQMKMLPAPVGEWHRQGPGSVFDRGFSRGAAWKQRESTSRCALPLKEGLFFSVPSRDHRAGMSRTWPM